MKAQETFSESCEYPQPQRIFRPFVADIYETGNLEPQSVFVYPTHLDGTTVDVEIKMMILVRPEAIREDVSAALYSEYPELTLGHLHFHLSPKIYSI